jgi:hypothetical protein
VIDLLETHLIAPAKAGALCGKKARYPWLTSVYTWSDCTDCVAVADQMMAADEQQEAARSVPPTTRRDLGGRIGQQQGPDPPLGQ